MPKSSGQGNWVTINGVHVLIDSNKKIIKGPKNLIGMTPRQAIGLDSTDSKSSAKSEKSPASKAMAKAKSDREADPSKKKKADGLVNRAKRQTAKSYGFGKSDLKKMSDDELIASFKEVTSEKSFLNDAKRAQIAGDAIGNELYTRGLYNSKTLDNAQSTTKAKVAKNPNNRLHTGREASNGLNPKQTKLFNQYVNQGYSGNDAYKIATTGRVPSVQVSGGAVAPTSSRQAGSTTPRTGNALFDNATKSNKATSGKSSSGLSVVHYDGFGRRGSWNEYKINGKKVSAKEARKQFPNMFDSKGRYNGGKK